MYLCVVFYLFLSFTLIFLDKRLFRLTINCSNLRLESSPNIHISILPSVLFRLAVPSRRWADCSLRLSFLRYLQRPSRDISVRIAVSPKYSPCSPKSVSPRAPCAASAKTWTRWNRNRWIPMWRVKRNNCRYCHISGIFCLLLYYIRVTSEKFRCRRIFRVIIRAEETASIRLYTV